jgi:PKD repeat protein
VVDTYATNISFLADQPRGLTAVFKPAVTFYVSTTGLDSNNGSESLPFATLTNAVAQVTAVYNSANAYAIIIEDGEYTHGNIQINVPLTIKSRNGLDSVTLVNSIVIDAGTASTAANVAFYLNADGIVLDGLLLRAASTATGRAITAVKRAIIRNCAVRNWQTANYSVDGIVVVTGGSILDRCEIINCLLRSSGGQPRYGIVYVYGNAVVSETVITNCSLYRQPSSSGSAIFASGTAVNSLLIRNSLIAKCTSDRVGTTDLTLGGAIYLSGANMKAVIENVTLAHCKDIGLGVAGLNVRSIASLAARNVLFYDNRNSSTVKDVGFAAGMAAKSQFDNCAFTAPIPAEIVGSGNVTVYEPFGGEGVYQPALSPAVDSGVGLDWMTTDATDVFGNPRVKGAAVDMGAGERSPSGPLVCSFSCDKTRDFVPTSIAFQAVADGANLDGLTYLWSFRDGKTIDLSGSDPTHATPSFTYTDAGYWTVKLTVTNNAGESASMVASNLILAVPQTLYVSTNGTAELPYDTWARAARSPLDAVDFAVDNCTILVSNGIYALNRDIILAAAVALRSVEGPEVTILDRGNQSGSRVVYLNYANTVLDGFTCQRAQLYNIQSGISSALVTNCISRQCAGSYDSRGAGARMEAGTITHCQIYNNSNYSTGGQGTWGTGIYLAGGAFANCCVISNNTMGANNAVLSQGAGVYLAGANTVLRNSLVCGNRSVRGSAGVHAVSGAAVENCTIIDNTCSTAHPGAVGLVGPGSGSVNVTNTIIWGNLFVATELNYAGMIKAGAVCTTPLMTAGEGHIDTPPTFRGRAAGDYRLAADSSCVERGIRAPWMDGTTDLAGAPRIVRKKVDIGCYEYPLLPGTFLFLR